MILLWVSREHNFVTARASFSMCSSLMKGGANLMSFLAKTSESIWYGRRLFSPYLTGRPSHLCTSLETVQKGDYFVYLTISSDTDDTLM